MKRPSRPILELGTVWRAETVSGCPEEGMPFERIVLATARTKAKLIRLVAQRKFWNYEMVEREALIYGQRYMVIELSTFDTVQGQRSTRRR